MRFKLDENLGSRSAHILRKAGHDVETVLDENLSGAGDETIYQVCGEESRCLITLDMDFADFVRFPPGQTSGIAVLRLPKHASLNLLEKLVSDLLRFLDCEQITGRLWIVESGRIRVRESIVALKDGAID